jgi:hypothetical protein
MSKGKEMGRSVYKQPETKVDGSCHSEEGFQVSERGIEKGARGISKGRKRARGLRHVYCNLHMCT